MHVVSYHIKTESGDYIYFEYVGTNSKKKIAQAARKFLEELNPDTMEYANWEKKVLEMEERVANKEVIMKFGKYKGTYVMDIPMSYIMWLYHLDNYDELEQKLRNAIERKIQRFINRYIKTHPCNN
jgi:c-di-AMP phosphodiesterase-like protein